MQGVREATTPPPPPPLELDRIYEYWTRRAEKNGPWNCVFVLVENVSFLWAWNGFNGMVFFVRYSCCWFIQKASKCNGNRVCLSFVYGWMTIFYVIFFFTDYCVQQEHEITSFFEFVSNTNTLTLFSNTLHCFRLLFSQLRIFFFFLSNAICFTLHFFFFHTDKKH